MAAPKWQDRSWVPSEEESLLVGLLRNGKAGEILLRKVDDLMQTNMDSCGGHSTGNEYCDLQEVNRIRGAIQALNVVLSWLLIEPDPEPQENEND